MLFSPSRSPGKNELRGVFLVLSPPCRESGAPQTGPELNRDDEEVTGPPQPPATSLLLPPTWFMRDPLLWCVDAIEEVTRELLDTELEADD